MVLGKNIAQTTITLVLTTGAATALSILIPRLLGPVRFGEYTYVLWVAGLVAMGTQLGLPDAVKKFVADLWATERSGNAKRLAITLAYLQTALALAGSAVMVYISLNYVHEPNTKLLMWLAAAATPFSTIGCIFSDAINGTNAVYLTSRFACVCGIVSGLLSFALVTLGAGAVGILATMLVMNAVYFVGMYRIFRRHFKSAAPNAETIGVPPSRLLKYCIGAFAATACSCIALDKSEIFFVKQNMGIEAAGMYVLAFNLAQKVLILPRALSGVLIPAFAQSYSKGEQGATQTLFVNSTRAYFATMTPIALLLAANAEPLIRLLYGAIYLPCTNAFVIALCTVPAAAFTLPATSVVSGITGVSLSIFGCLVLPSAIDVGLAALLVPKWGLAGAAAANMAAQWILALLLVVYVRLKYGFALPVSHFVKTVVGSTVAAAVTCVAAHGLHYGYLSLFVCSAMGAAVVAWMYKHLQVFTIQELEAMKEHLVKLPAFARPIARAIISWLEGDSLILK